MGLLTPLYLAGLGAIALPILFHLIRRTPRGRQMFSSLMFLTPSPPRLTRRSRLDQWLLLLLRAGVLVLFAMAFARPFLRESSMLLLDEPPARRVAILLDTSASMRRGDLWPQAVAKASEVLSDLGEHDEVALFAFSDRLEPVVHFDREGDTRQVDKRELVRQRLKELSPTWRATDLAGALVSVANELDVASDANQTSAEPHLVLISDLQRGARTDALQSFAWPERVRVVAHRVTPGKTTNAMAHLLVDEQSAEETEPRVRIANAASSTAEQFFVRWANDKPGASDEGRMAVHVPPGQSRVLRLPRPEGALQADRLVLEGDDDAFDNNFYVVPPRQQNVAVAYIGDDGSGAKGLRYFLELALAGDPLRKVELVGIEPGKSPWLPSDSKPELVVVSAAAAAERRYELAKYLKAGGTLLSVPVDMKAAESILPLFEDLALVEQQDAQDGGYLMLGEIDFAHPLFAPLSNPKYNDFTKIHFWRHRAIEQKSPATSHVVARFDNRRPAIVERRQEKGRLLLLSSGWHPEESQLALSSKFVPLVQNLLELACGGPMSVANVTVGEPALLPQVESSFPTEIHTPDGQRVSLAAAARQFDQTDAPGLYRITSGERELRFAVNLAAAESNTAPLDLEQLEQLGVRFGTELTRAERIERQRQQRDVELESRQKVWRWLIVGALVLVILETLLAGRAARQTAAAVNLAGT